MTDSEKLDAILQELRQLQYQVAALVSELRMRKYAAKQKTRRRLERIVAETDRKPTELELRKARRILRRP